MKSSAAKYVLFSLIKNARVYIWAYLSLGLVIWFFLYLIDICTPAFLRTPLIFKQIHVRGSHLPKNLKNRQTNNPGLPQAILLFQFISNHDRFSKYKLN